MPRCVAGVAWPALRLAQWSVRVGYAGADTPMVTMPVLLGLWLGNILFWLALLPWCIGFNALVIDSLL
jgi:hypothetical protein